VTHRGEEFGELAGVPVKAGPAFELVDIHSPHLLRRLYSAFSAFVELFSALYAENKRVNLRKEGDFRPVRVRHGGRNQKVEIDIGGDELAFKTPGCFLRT
jgi:hypothetical protein